MNWPFRAVFALSILALVIGPFHVEPKRVRPLPAAAPGSTVMDGEGSFVPGGYPATSPVAYPVSALATRGSHVPGGTLQGSFTTEWIQARPGFDVMVSGYPRSESNRLAVEIQRKTGTGERIPYSGPDPGETWRAWGLKLPRDAVALRLCAKSSAGGSQGWFAFSQPFEGAPLSYRDFVPLLQVAATICLALALFWGPGLCWFQSRERPASDLALATLPGPLILCALGLACWGLGGWVDGHTTARIGIGLILAVMARPVWRGKLRFESEIAAVLGVGALLAVFAVARADFSYGPPGELYRGSVSRTLEVGGHSDSRIPFHAVQVAAHHYGPFSPESEAYFLPWRFTSRGPLTGLAATPLVLATGAEVPADMPDQAWTPFDPQGFAAFRIGAIVIASLAAWAVFGVAADMLGLSWALLAASLTFLAPFFVHELYFTWPKLIAAAGVLIAFLFVRRGRPVAAGLAVGFGYLCHPSAILAAPFLCFWVMAIPSPQSRGAALLRLCSFSSTVLVFVASWLVLGRIETHGGATQDAFLHYFMLADNHSADWPTWLWSRWNNFANTFVPLRLFLADPTQPSINSYYGPSDGWVHFGFLYWNTLPFAVGWPAFFFVGPALLAACWRQPLIALAAFVGPCAFLVIYWGFGSTGLMQECGHWLFLSVLLLAAWTLREPGGAWRRRFAAALTHPALMLLSGLDVAWMAFGATLHDRLPNLDAPFGWNDSIALAFALGCLGAAVYWMAIALRPLHRSLCAFERH